MATIRNSEYFKNHICLFIAVLNKSPNIHMTSFGDKALLDSVLITTILVFIEREITEDVITVHTTPQPLKKLNK